MAAAGGASCGYERQDSESAAPWMLDTDPSALSDMPHARASILALHAQDPFGQYVRKMSSWQGQTE